MPMPTKGSRQKSARFNPISGGKLLVVHGGWAAGHVQLPMALVGGDLFVHAALHSNGSPFALIVFGRKKTTASDRAKVTVLQTLINLMRHAVCQAAADARARGDDANAAAVVAAAAPGEDDGEAAQDPMALAEAARSMDDKSQKTRKEYRVIEKYKTKQLEGSNVQRVIAISHPVRRNSDKRKQISVLQHCRKQRASGLWISLKDLPWLATYAAEEVATADGIKLNIPGAQNVGGCGGGPPTARLEFIAEKRRWEYKWVDSETDVAHHIIKDVPKWCFVKGRLHRVDDNVDFARLKEKMRIAIMQDVKERGFSQTLQKDDDSDSDSDN